MKHEHALSVFFLFEQSQSSIIFTLAPVGRITPLSTSLTILMFLSAKPENVSNPSNDKMNERQCACRRLLAVPPRPSFDFPRLTSNVPFFFSIPLIMWLSLTHPEERNRQYGTRAAVISTHAQGHRKRENSKIANTNLSGHSVGRFQRKVSHIVNISITLFVSANTSVRQSQTRAQLQAYLRSVDIVESNEQRKLSHGTWMVCGGTRTAGGTTRRRN